MTFHLQIFDYPSLNNKDIFLHNHNTIIPILKNALISHNTQSTFKFPNVPKMSFYSWFIQIRIKSPLILNCFLSPTHIFPHVTDLLKRPGQFSCRMSHILSSCLFMVSLRLFLYLLFPIYWN